MKRRGLLIKHFCKTKKANETEKIFIFYFSHYKSMEKLSCNSNRSSYLTGIKSIIYEEANVLNNYAKFQLHPPYGFLGEDFLIFFFRSN